MQLELPSHTAQPVLGGARREPLPAEPSARALRLLVAGLWATVSIVGWETWQTCRGLEELRAQLVAQSLALNLAAALIQFLPTFFLVLLLAALDLSPGLPAYVQRWRLAVEVAAAGGAVLAAQRTLALYPPFAAARSVQLAFMAVFAYAAAACWIARMSRAPASTRAGVSRRWLALAAMVLGLAGAVAAEWLHATLYVNEYPSLHASLVQLAHLLAVLGLWHALQRPWRERPVRLRGALWLAPLLASVLLLALHAAGASAPARPQYRSASVFGLSEALWAPYSEALEIAGRPVLDAPDALRRFGELARLPELPADLDLARQNVLLVLGESTRFDQTSLGDPALDTTPQLLRWKERGAFSFVRAYAPSSATFLALAGIFGMSYPSLLPLETWNKPWTGRLLESAGTVAESFRDAGYDTFWVGHDHRGSFTHALLGFEAGFAERELIGGDERTDTALDRRIAERAIAELAERAGAERRFFGFVFLASPHHPYLTHDGQRPHETELERYRQELRAMDEQLGRLLAALDGSPLAANTTVIIMGDHGEEFGEHGGHQHHSSVYLESLHVPLLVRIPGVAGRRVEVPVSSAYVLPWLIARGSPAQRADLEGRLARELVPLLEATDGAVVAEILGHDRVKSTLIYEDAAFVYDFYADRPEAYRLPGDPAQARDRFGTDAPLTARALRQLGEYRNVRADRRRFRLRPELLDPRNAR